MEPSGRNQWQSVANGNAQKRLKQAKTVAVGCDRLPIGAHGKEGVDGSSPSEGLPKMPATGHLSSHVLTTHGYTAGTFLVTATHHVA
jgi:hypothetical protein